MIDKILIWFQFNAYFNLDAHYCDKISMYSNIYNMFHSFLYYSSAISFIFEISVDISRSKAYFN